LIAQPGETVLDATMKIQTRTFLSLFLVILSCQATRSPAQAEESAAIPKAPARILFVGNSFTYYNGGLETHVRELAKSANPPRILETERATQGGATLRILFGKEAVLTRIREGHFDVVVLQEDIPELVEHSMEPFFEYVRLFDQEIKKSKARTVLFMAWPYQRLNWVSLPEITQAHQAIARKLQLTVAPVGTALAKSLELNPGLAMLGPDREHETRHGTYLAASLIYATLFQENPAGFSYCPEGIAPAEARQLQQLAWQTVQAWPAPLLKAAP